MERRRAKRVDELQYWIRWIEKRIYSRLPVPISDRIGQCTKKSRVLPQRECGMFGHLTIEEKE